MRNPIPGNIVALFDAMTLEALDALRPAERERFRQMCQHWAALASESKGAGAKEPKSYAVVFQRATEATRALSGPRTVGVLAQLRDGERAENSDERHVPRECHP